jgi:dethiobiotin synthetase
VSRLVVVGTGTDVGKTHVSCSLVAALRARAAVAAWKPVASGVESGMEAPDTSALAAALGAPVAPPLYAFAEPISPHLAARRAGVVIDIAALAARAQALAAGVEVLLVETAGGLFSPLGPGVTNADLARALGGALVLVAPDRLGVLHDVTATLIALRQAGLSLAALALSAPAVPDASTGTNAAEIEAMTGQPVAAVFARAAPDAPASLGAAAALLARAGVVLSRPGGPARGRPRPGSARAPACSTRAGCCSAARRARRR